MRVMTAMITRATLDLPDGSRLERVRVVYSDSEAYALDSRGQRVWEAQLSSVERPSRGVVLLRLADPDGAVAKAERNCGCRS